MEMEHFIRGKLQWYITDDISTIPHKDGCPCPDMQKSPVPETFWIYNPCNGANILI